MKSKKSVKQTTRTLNSDGEIEEVEDTGVVGLFQPGEWDIAEEFSNNEALIEYRRELAGDKLDGN